MTKLKELKIKRNFLILDLKNIDENINKRIQEIINRISDKCSTCKGLGYTDIDTMNWGTQRQKCNCTDGRIIRPSWIKIFNRIKGENK